MSTLPASMPLDNALRWWLPRDVPVGHTLEWRLGTLYLEIHHGEGEWQLASRVEEESEFATARDARLRAGPPASESMERFLAAGGGDRLALSPVLADRPVVIRPRHPVFLLSGQETVMYLSTPLSVRITVGAAATQLREVPMLRLSDTWFGPSTREGELCYSGRTHARHALAEVPLRAHRAITPVRIANHASSVLPLDKISLPVPLLSVYGASDGRLWTESVSLQRASDSDMASLRIDPSPPVYAGEVERLAGPRQPAARGGVVRAFSLLFGE